MIQSGVACFAKNRFLRCQWEFDYVRAHATTHVGKFMVVKVVDAVDGNTKLGIIVSKKCHKSSVKRNRARRLVRESFRLIASEIKPAKWIIVIARGWILNRKRQEVQQELMGLLIDANAYSSRKNS